MFTERDPLLAAADAWGRGVFEITARNCDPR